MDNAINQLSAANQERWAKAVLRNAGHVVLGSAESFELQLPSGEWKYCRTVEAIVNRAREAVSR